METISNNTPKLHIKKPAWLKTKIPTGRKYFELKRDVKKRKLATVCEEAKCPNIGECWNQESATIMILGDTCTRACRFCNVKTGNPQGWVDINEPREIAEKAQGLGLKYIVLTMVDRDDIADGGAAHVAEVVKNLKEYNPGIKIELLSGDFAGSTDALDKILTAGLDVFAHNIETVKSLTTRVRDARASYVQSLEVLRYASENYGKQVFIKSGMMLGLGEELEEIHETLQDLRNVGVNFMSIGQYMRPSKKHLSIKRWVHPDEFEGIKNFAMNNGFLSVASGPLVRSSYMAREFYESGAKRFEESH